MNPSENTTEKESIFECSQYVFLVNEQTKKRIERSKYLTYFMSKILGYSVVYSGSRSEGVPSGKSDTDIMFEAEGVIAISRETDLADNITCVFMDLKDVHQGYTRLAFQNDENGKDYSEFAAHGSGLRFLRQPGSNYISNTLVLDYWNSQIDKIVPEHGNMKDSRFHGPCVLMSYAALKNQAEVDITISFKSEWPAVAEEWLIRPRKYGWPSKELIDQIRSRGINLVPVGHANSQSKELEWRLSFSKAERQLVWSFNPTQLFCIGTMKAFFSIMITPNFPDLFPSYFIKTAMFWLIEETDYEVWKPENLLLCLGALHKRLITFLEKKKIKNYFIPADNMMDAKPAKELESLKNELVKYQVNCDDMWIQLIEEKMSTFDQNDIYHHHIMINCLSLSRGFIYTDMKDQTFEICLKRIEGAIMILENSNTFPDMCKLLIHELNIMKSCLKFCTLCADNYSNVENARKEIEDDISSGVDLNHSTGRLTLASFLFCTKQYEETLKLVQVVDKSFTAQVVHYSFLERSKNPRDKDYDISKPRSSLEDTMRQYIALDVVLLPCLRLIYPETIQTLLAKENLVIFIHPLLYANALRFHCLLALLKFEECRMAINDMKQFVASNKDIIKCTSDLTPVYLTANCLRVLGCTAEAEAFVTTFEQFARSRPDKI